MLLRELGKICKENRADCDNCDYENYCCHTLPEILEDISPYALLDILDMEVED